LVGHSQGCLEILEYAHRYKKRLNKIVFVGGSNKMPVHPDLIKLAQNGDFIKSGCTGILFDPPTKTILLSLFLYLWAYSRISKHP
jgi:pimeloyl-ACP methyl ester carboxylesterase